MCESSNVDASDLSISAAVGDKDPPDLTLMEAMERNAIIQMLKETGGNKLETAKRLGIGPSKRFITRSRFTTLRLRHREPIT